MATDTGTNPPTAPYVSLDRIAGTTIVVMTIEAAFGFASAFYPLIDFGGGVSIVLSLVNLILFLIWFHRADKNLSALGATELRFTPGWAVAWWFIPIFFFWKPYQVTVEIMKSSDPTVGKTDSATRKAMERPNLILIWWIYSFFGAAISAGVAFGFAQETPWGDRDTSFVPSLVSAVVGAIGTWLVILVIREITKRQRTKIELMRSGGNAI
jgi:uncharacterized protein DUF4328